MGIRQDLRPDSQVQRGVIEGMLKYRFKPTIPQNFTNLRLPFVNAMVLIMTTIQINLCERLKRLGFSRQNQVKLYGSQFELVGDPLAVSDDVVFVDAVEQKSGQHCRVRIPLNIIRMATERAAQTYAA